MKIPMKVKCLLLLTIFSTSIYSQEFSQFQKITSQDRDESDRFGTSLHIDRDYLIVGASSDDEDELGGNPLNDSGAAYIFKKDENDQWNQVQKIVHADRNDRDLFGENVFIKDGIAIVSARWQDGDESGQNTLTDAGAVYVFVENIDGSWSETQKLVASDRSIGDSFGSAVSINNEFIIIGSIFEDNQPFDAAGAAYIFKEDASGNWVEQQKIVASVRTEKAYFGNLLISDDNYIMVAEVNDFNETESNSIGSVYVFEKGINDQWNETQILTASDGDIGDKFGRALSISEDWLIIGAYNNDYDQNGNNEMNNSGSVYIFNKDMDGTWLESQKFVSSDRNIDDGFGGAVAINGSFAIIGAQNEDEDSDGMNTISDAGSVYILEKDLNGIWSEVQKVVQNDRKEKSLFGRYVTIQEGITIVSAVLDDTDATDSNFLVNSGSVYVFNNGNTLGIEQLTINFKTIAYPNPFDNKISINFGKVISNIKVTVTNVLGQKVYSKKFYNRNVIDLDLMVEKGIYFIELINDNTLFNPLKLIKK